MVAAGLEFYRLHGWFAFPVNVQPGPEYLQAVAETQSLYDASPKPKTPAAPGV
jgi:hypothetical protein